MSNITEWACSLGTFPLTGPYHVSAQVKQHFYNWLQGMKKRIYSLGVCSPRSAVGLENKGQSQWTTKAILSGNFFHLTAKQLKFHGTTSIELFLGYPHSYWIHPHAIVSSQCELIKASLLKVVFYAESQSPASLCLSLLSSGVVLFHLLEFAHFLLPGCPSFLQEGRKVTEGSHCQFHQPNRMGGWTKQISVFWKVGSPITLGFACPWHRRTKTWPL